MKEEGLSRRRSESHEHFVARPGRVGARMVQQHLSSRAAAGPTVETARTSKLRPSPESPDRKKEEGRIGRNRRARHRDDAGGRSARKLKRRTSKPSAHRNEPVVHAPASVVAEALLEAAPVSRSLLDQDDARRWLFRRSSRLRRRLSLKVEESPAVVIERRNPWPRQCQPVAHKAPRSPHQGCRDSHRARLLKQACSGSRANTARRRWPGCPATPGRVAITRAPDAYPTHHHCRSQCPPGDRKEAVSFRPHSLQRSLPPRFRARASFASRRKKSSIRAARRASAFRRAQMLPMPWRPPHPPARVAGVAMKSFGR